VGLRHVPKTFMTRLLESRRAAAADASSHLPLLGGIAVARPHVGTARGALASVRNKYELTVGLTFCIFTVNFQANEYRD